MRNVYCSWQKEMFGDFATFLRNSINFEVFFFFLQFKQLIRPFIIFLHFGVLVASQ